MYPMYRKWGTKWVHKEGLTRFLDSLCIMHLMYVYIHENSEIKFLLFWTLTFDDLSRASKWGQNEPKAQKQLQILKAQVMSFPMIYNMSWLYTSVFFLSTVSTVCGICHWVAQIPSNIPTLVSKIEK